MNRFLQTQATKHNISSYEELREWSVGRSQKPDVFWSEVLEFFNVSYQGNNEPAYRSKKFLDYSWFPNVKLSFAENLLKNGRSDDVAISSLLEDGTKRELSYAELSHCVSLFQDYIKEHISEDKVLAAYMPNVLETVVAMLGTNGLGGIFTSTSCDFGIKGVLDRFGQTEPKVLVSVLSYEYNGKRHSLLNNLREIVSSIGSIERVILIDLFSEGEGVDISGIRNAEIVDIYSSSLKASIEGASRQPIFTQRNFSAPLYIMYSSGTTGKPKCIVHSAGGTLLQHIKELGLHTDLSQSKSIFYFTTCGWMMWNWLVSSLFFGSKVYLYEGSPGYPSLDSFMGRVDGEGVNIFGTSPKFLKALEEGGYDKNYELKYLETLLSTGAPLYDEQFSFVYDKIKSDIMLSSIAGGTDIIGCFMLGNPLLPVYQGEITCRGLGMDVAVFDQNGEPVVGEEGELVCLSSFPSEPIYFWKDPGKEIFKESYFSEYEGVWRHGDYVRLSDKGSIRIFGRSDATLNPGGVRIGTAEIYSLIEKMDGIQDALCVGQNFEGDVRVVLFVQTDPEVQLDETLIKTLKASIRSELTPRHVPEMVLPVTGIPYTRSGKKMETLVQKIFNGREIKNLEAVSNPECIDEYRNLASKHAQQ